MTRAARSLGGMIQWRWEWQEIEYSIYFHKEQHMAPSSTRCSLLQPLSTLYGLWGKHNAIDSKLYFYVSTLNFKTKTFTDIGIGYAASYRVNIYGFYFYNASAILLLFQGLYKLDGKYIPLSSYQVDGFKCTTVYFLLGHILLGDLHSTITSAPKAVCYFANASHMGKSFFATETPSVTRY